MGALHQEGEKLVPDQTCAAIHRGGNGKWENGQKFKKKKKKGSQYTMQSYGKTKNIPPLA